MNLTCGVIDGTFWLTTSLLANLDSCATCPSFDSAIQSCLASPHDCHFPTKDSKMEEQRTVITLQQQLARVKLLLGGFRYRAYRLAAPGIRGGFWVPPSPQ